MLVFAPMLSSKTISQKKELLLFALILLAALFTDLLLVQLIKPLPLVFDEFAHLLIGDTLASARVCNPSHPLFIFFESNQIQNLPCYTGRFPPLLGLTYALPLAMQAEPLLGIIALHALCLFVFWRFFSKWFSSLTRFLLLLVVAFHPAIISGWVLTYWGGMGSMLGGVLVLSAALSFNPVRPYLATAIILLGSMMLLLSRPYEGLVLLFGILICLPQINKNKIQPKHAAYLFALIFCCGSITWGAYNYKTTGNALESAYIKYQRQYSIAQPFFFTKDRTPEKFAYPEMAEFYRREAAIANWHRNSVTEYLKFTSKKIGMQFRFYLGSAALLLLLAALLVGVRHPLLRFTLSLTSFVTVFGLAPVVFNNQPYSAPFAAVFFLGLAILIEAVVKSCRSDAFKLISLGLFLLLFFAEQIKQATEQQVFFRSTTQVARNKLFEPLRKDQFEHLIFVIYDKSDLSTEFVYNSANIDQQKVIIARDLGAEANKALIKYYPARKYWVLTISDSVLLLPYDRIFTKPPASD